MGHEDGDRNVRDVKRGLAASVGLQAAHGRTLALAAVPMVAVLLMGQIDRTMLLIWVAIAATEAIVDRVAVRPHLLRMAAGQVEDRWQARVAPHAATFGLVWGSLPLLALRGERQQGFWLTVVIVLAILTTYVVSTAGSRIVFGAGLIGMIVPLALAIALSDTAPWRLAPVALVYGGIAIAMHHTLHLGLESTMRSRHEAERLAGQLNEFVSARDPATQLLNRRSFIASVDAVLADGRERDIVVEVGSVRRLTAINELYGDQFGDALIVHIGERLQDVAEQHGVAARLGGDEFALATWGTGPEMSLRGLASGHFTLGGVTSTVDFSSVEVRPSRPRATGEELVGEAVAALRAERSARALTAAVRIGGSPTDRRELVSELRDGLTAAGVGPWFQPIVDARTRKVVGWEALLRWQHPTIGMVSPERLLPLIDIAGMGSQLVELVVVESLSLLCQLDAAGAAGHSVHVNVNATDLRNVALPDTVLGAVHDSRISPERLVLELTEREILRLDHEVRAAIGRLDAAGVHIAVDDFGTGYSSLSHLLDIPVDHLKIDRRFISGLPHDLEAVALVRGIVSMAGGLGLTAVAEGVETEAAAESARSLGCDQLQGYLIAPALSVVDAIAWWRAHRESSLPAVIDIDAAEPRTTTGHS